MPFSGTMTITDVRALVRQIIAALTDDLPEAITQRVADDAVLPRLREYPPPSRKPMAFKSAAQRRALFAMLRSGQITVPYQRTNALRNSWQKAPQGAQALVVRSQGVSYAELVVGERQGDYHKGNWWTVTEVAQVVEAEEAEGLATEAAIDLLRQRGWA